MSKKATAGSIYSALSRRYAEPEWALFPQVANSTGHVQRRWADAVAMNLYPSRGLVVIGFEIKVSRSDWIAELRNPEKSAAVQKYCHHWYVVAPKGLIDQGEVPATWGLIELAGKRLYTTVKAPDLAAGLDHGFMAAVLRRAREGMVANAEVKAIAAEEHERKGRKGDLEVEKLRDDHHKLVKSVKEFEAAAGFKLADRWHLTGKATGQAVRMLAEGDPIGMRLADLQELERIVARISNSIGRDIGMAEEVIKAMKSEGEQT